MFAYYGDFGRSPFRSVRKIAKRTGKVLRTPITAVRHAVKGEFKQAGKSILEATNPVLWVTKALTDNPRKLDYARLAVPTTVVNITNRKLRKQAAVGYAAAALVAGAVFALAPAAGAGAAGAGATTAGATGATGVTAATGATAATAAPTLTASGLLTKAALAAAPGALSKLTDKAIGEGEERAGGPGETQLIESEIQHFNIKKYMPHILAGTVGLVAIGTVIYLMKKPSASVI